MKRSHKRFCKKFLLNIFRYKENNMKKVNCIGKKIYRWKPNWCGQFADSSTNLIFQEKKVIKNIVTTCLRYLESFYLIGLYCLLFLEIDGRKSLKLLEFIY